MFGVSGAEFFVIVLVAVLVVGPQRLPEYARKLAQGVRRLRLFVEDTKVQIAEEVGPELADLNLADLDPRNYDPRKIVRDALGEDLEAIRRDLASPFESVAKAAKETSEAAAGAVAGSRASKSLSTMIDDKAKETAAAAETVPADQEPQEAAAPAVDSGAEAVPETGTAAETRAAGEAVPEAAAAAEAVPTDQETVAGEAETETEAVPTDQEPQEAAAEAVDSEAEAVPAVAPVPRRGVLQGVARAASPDPASPDEAAIPSSLVAADPVEPAARTPLRPLSPRDIVRAANAAARTRAEAATATVDV